MGLELGQESDKKDKERTTVVRKRSGEPSPVVTHGTPGLPHRPGGRGSVCHLEPPLSPECMKIQTKLAICQTVIHHCMSCHFSEILKPLCSLSSCPGRGTPTSSSLCPPRPSTLLLLGSSLRTPLTWSGHRDIHCVGTGLVFVTDHRDPGLFSFCRRLNTNFLKLTRYLLSV